MILHEPERHTKCIIFILPEHRCILLSRDCVRRRSYRCRVGQGNLELPSGWEEEVGSYSSLQEEYHFEAASSTCHCPQE